MLAKSNMCIGQCTRLLCSFKGLDNSIKDYMESVTLDIGIILIPFRSRIIDALIGNITKWAPSIGRTSTLFKITLVKDTFPKGRIMFGTNLPFPRRYQETFALEIC